MPAHRFPGRRLAVAVATGLGGLLLAGPALAAPAPPGAAVSVLVPGQPMERSLRLVGASGFGVAVVQGDDDFVIGSRYDTTVLTGAEGDELTPRPAIRSEGWISDRVLLGVHDDELGWAVQRGQGNYEQSAWRAHRTNIFTGDDHVDGTISRPSVFTGNWFTYSSLLRYPADGDSIPLLKHFAGTGAGGVDGEMAVNRFGDDGRAIVDVAADDWTVVKVVADPPLPGPYEQDTAESRTYRVQRFENGGPWETLAETTDAISSVAFSRDTFSVAWDSQAPGQSRRIHTRRETENGPEETVFTDSDPDVADVDLAAGAGGVGYLVWGQDGDGAGQSELRIVNGETARTVPLPAGSAGLAAVGDRFLTAAGGSDQIAGVYSVSPDDRAVRTATVPSATQPVTGLSLAASTLYYADTTLDAAGYRSIWKTPVGAGLKLGKAKRVSLSGLPAEPAEQVQGQAFFSAGRGLVLGPDTPYKWRLLDRGKVTGTIDALNGYDVRPVISGPYALLERTVVDPEGEVVYSIPEANWYGSGQRDLFGSSVVFSLYPDYPESDAGAEVWLDDIENQEPELLGHAKGCWPGAPVSVWGELVAWISCETGVITIRNLRTGQERTVEGGPQSVYAASGRLELGEGAVFWTTYSDERSVFEGHVLDLLTPGATPVDLAGDWGLAAFDDHLLAHRTSIEGRVEVQRLPFEARYRPRLIGKLADASFRAAAEQTWKPRFDVTKPLVDVKLTITDAAGQVVRTLTGTAPDGSVRDLTWDGRDRQGRLQKVGLYRWTLTGSAADGDGTLRGKRGGELVTGSVRIKG
ncbi:FlgD immunoglobulin-like domain containing protein [Kineosporia succinea]|uniref:FlgD/Vpr Ig-like domain-containing protein n=1 Tax=Kineosporia succinea TaxID=84632 RepID=A0ABT9NXB6_9ACTN|nr:FlgD immunoglobulin-like domain containing protein [Kineosporia succinea]MDP9825071.1 hypothetical protein [Kineosporia succinea]